jgi:callose synthase
VFLFFQVVSLGREKFVTKFQLVFRILKGIVFIILISLMVLLFVGFDLAVSDVGASILAFIPTGWFILLVSNLCIILPLALFSFPMKSTR